MKKYEVKNIVFIDGECLICNKLILFLNFFDRGNNLKFSNLQGDWAKKILSEDYTKELNTVVYLRDNSSDIYIKSTALIILLADIYFPFILLKCLLIIPTTVRDYLYNFIAKNRYKIGKKLDTCPIPAKNLSDKYIL